MIDKSARTAGAHTVHPFLGGRAKIHNLGIFAAQFHHRIRLRNQFLHRCGGGDYLLHKRQVQTLRNTHTRTACQRKGKRTRTHHVMQTLQVIMERRRNFREMPGIMLRQDMIFFVQSDQLDCGRTYINTNLQYTFHC